MRLPIDLPPMTSARVEAIHTTFNHVSRGMGSRSGGFFLPLWRDSAMYANSERATRIPRPASPAAKAFMNGVWFPAPAPWARTIVYGAFFGPSKIRCGLPCIVSPHLLPTRPALPCPLWHRGELASAGVRWQLLGCEASIGL